MDILVTGGAGYIGSHITKSLYKNGFNAVILDNLNTGHAHLAKFGILQQFDIQDKTKLQAMFQDYDFKAVIHCAASTLVGESIINPSLYYRNNVLASLELLDVMQKYGVKNLIFSSSAAVYGETQFDIISEDHPKNPINPYGQTKLTLEKMASDYVHAYGLNAVAMRYFNVTGADPEGELGECHTPETHLIPLILHTALGKRDHIKIYGKDYDTKDGTCIRDYVHVSDVATAHTLILSAMIRGEITGFHDYNIANGSGHSIAEIVSMAKEIVGYDDYQANVINAQRREGDPTSLVADISKIKKNIPWQPCFTLKESIEHAWHWEKSKMLIYRPINIH